VTVNGESLYATVSDELRIFQSSYSNKNDEWTGDVRAFAVDPKTGKVLTDDEDIKWSAADTLNTLLEGEEARNIFSYNRADSKGILFSAGDLSAEQMTELGPEPASVVEFIRGQKLRDIVHSAPVFENNVVYVGANDGMLHAFDVLDDGNEIFAYVPDLVFENLSALADPDYTHQYYVDLTPTVKKGKGILGEEKTATLLVGGLGKGGRGYFALDISDPQKMETTDIKWEFPNADTEAEHIADMGYSYSRPVIVQSSRAVTSLNWVVIFGNGYGSPNGNSVLFIVDPKDGSVLTTITAGTGPDNGLSTPIAIDVDLDNKVDFVYAGDLKGNLWKFDLTSSNKDDWDVAYKDGGDPRPLFTARGPEEDENQAIQPITMKPDVMLHPSKPGYLVCFGTGKFLGTSDFSDKTTQSIYGIWDYGDKIFDLARLDYTDDDDSEFLGKFKDRDPGAGTQQLSNQNNRVRLLKQEVTDVPRDGQNLRILSDNEPEWITVPDPDDPEGQLDDPSSDVENHVGWYFDLSEGERAVSDLLIRDGRLIGIGFIPNDARCYRGGNSYFMEFDAATGGRLDTAVLDINFDDTVSGGTVEDPGDYYNLGTDEDPEWVSVSGLMIDGQGQTPIILEFRKPDPDCEDPPCPPPPCEDPPCPPPPPPECLEVKISSSSSGSLFDIKEKCSGAGMLYWQEVQYEVP
jgi:type IV pilus assembly protein PilY1